jgi:hypothetical protein
MFYTTFVSFIHIHTAVHIFAFLAHFLFFEKVEVGL